MTETTLMETAEREAAEAEAEYSDQEREEPEVRSKPGEQGIATRDEDEDEDEGPDVWDRSPSQQEIVLADDVLRELQERAHEMGAQGVVDALLRVVDVHPQLRMPASWPGDTEDRLLEAPFLLDIGRFLARGCPKIELSANQVVFLWRNQRTWSRNGVQIRAAGKKLGDVASFFAHGAQAVVTGNWQVFRLLNTRQKIAAVYHALRSLDSEGSPQPNQFEGFFDELELFGTGTFETDILLRRAIDHGAQRELPFEQTVDAFTAAEATDPESAGEDHAEAAD